MGRFIRSKWAIIFFVGILLEGPAKGQHVTPFSSSSFAPAGTVNTSRPNAAFIVDLGGDGHADMITLNTTYPHYDSISIFMNAGTAGTISFSPAIQFVLPGTNSNLTAGDINGDGKPDILVTNYFLNTVSVFINTSSPGKLSFDGGSQFPTGKGPDQVSLADIDGDGKQDIIVVDYSDGAISVLRNTGNSGTLSFAAKTDIAITKYPASMVINDLDTDEKPDFALVSSILDLVSLYKNTSTPGTISFIPVPWTDTLSGELTKIVSADFDGDGKPDLAVSNDSTSTLFIYKNITTAATISFASKIIIQPNTVPFDLFDISVCDLDGDGRPDIAGLQPNEDNIVVLQNTSSSGGISFAAGIDYNEKATPYWLRLGDLDGDGKPDMVATNYFDNSAVIFRNTVTNFKLPPRIAFFTPDSGSIGTQVTVHGANFTGAATVSFGGTSATSFIIDSDSIITATVGTGASGYLTIGTQNGKDSLGGFIFLGHRPILAYFAPTTGHAGTTVHIGGSYLSGITSVNFGGIPCASFVITSDTTVAAVVGTGGTGDVQVTSPYGADSLGVFTFTKTLTVAPNPTTGIVTVSFPFSSSPSQLKILDFSGNTIRIINIPPNTSQVTVDLTGIMPGEYVITWSNGSNSLSQTVLIL